MGFFNNKTITLYNRHIEKDSGYEVYIPTVLNNVNLVETQGANISTSGMSDADSAKLYIDILSIENNVKRYVSPKEYSRLSSDDMQETFTFTKGEDFFVKGDTSAQPISKSSFYEYMKSHFDGVYKITTVDVYPDVLPHYEIGGK